MPKLVELISEYFLGTKSREYYRNKTIHFEKIKNNNRNITKEISESLSEKIKYFKTVEKRVFYERIFSNSIDAASAISSLITKNPSYICLGILLGEYVRIHSLVTEKKIKRLGNLIKSLTNTASSINSEVDNAKVYSEQYKQ